MVDIYQLLDLAAVQVPALYPNCILLQVGVFPGPFPLSLSVMRGRCADMPGCIRLWYWMRIMQAVSYGNALRKYRIIHIIRYCTVIHVYIMSALYAAALGAVAFKDLRGRGLAVQALSRSGWHTPIPGARKNRRVSYYLYYIYIFHSLKFQKWLWVSFGIWAAISTYLQVYIHYSPTGKR